MKMFKGNGCAEGSAMGTALVKTSYEPVYTMDQVEDTEAELAFLDESMAALREKLQKLYARTLSQSGEEAAELIESYEMILLDKAFFDGVRSRIHGDKRNCKMAIKLECEQCRASFMAIDDPYLRERFSDIEDVCFKLVMQCDHAADALADITLTRPTILLADTLTPMDTVKLDKAFLAGFIVERGGATSHAVILAKTLGIPAIVGVEGICAQATSGSRVLMSGDTGEIILDGDKEAEARFTQMILAAAAEKEKYNREPAGPAYTQDGVHVQLAVNSGDAATAALLDPTACDGVGLFRTEFLYMAHSDYPSEETQFQAYKAAAEKMQGKPVIIRTLDIGGDKALDYMGLEPEENPFLGYRAIRICLDRPAMFMTQLRAILRASAFGKIKLMFPMIISLEELRKSKEYLETCKAQLRMEHAAFDENLAVGIMVETPAAVFMAAQLAQEVDFMSVGTNDLTQYITVADRGNARVQTLYDPLHPAVLRALYQIGEAACEKGIELGVCGETASMKKMIPFLLGVGVRELSVASGALGSVRYLVRRLSVQRCKEAADAGLRCATSDQAQAILEELVAGAE
ncbi:MAG: phosphoenolpyruvate--protein phosphotransferase [Candidatus Pelethousia sp.]|nr:phosphoenolpyruvate--protein phosphotransferase [Candidatus Pelethousia sp.]